MEDVLLKHQQSLEIHVGDANKLGLRSSHISTSALGPMFARNLFELCLLLICQ